MAEAKDQLIISDVNVNDINFVFQRIADRLDAIEGLRGTLNMNSTRITNVDAGSDDDDVLTVRQLRLSYPWESDFV